MTEAEWLACNEPSSMIWSGREFPMSSRKLRLLACACCRRVWAGLPPGDRDAIEIAERYADGNACEEDLRAAMASDPSHEHNAAWFAAAPKRAFRERASYSLKQAARLAAEGTSSYAAESSIQCHLIRDIFGNPFQPASVKSAWLRWQSGVLPRMARAIYDARSFDDLPFLADALEEAGCTDAALLTHCRGTGPHVRGCWPVDLLLGKP